MRGSVLGLSLLNSIGTKKWETGPIQPISHIAKSPESSKGSLFQGRTPSPSFLPRIPILEVYAGGILVLHRTGRPSCGDPPPGRSENMMQERAT